MWEYQNKGRGTDEMETIRKLTSSGLPKCEQREKKREMNKTD